MCPAGPLPPEKRLIVTSFLIIRRCFKLIPFWPSNFPQQPFLFHWTWYIASNQFTIYFVSTASPALPVQLCPSPIPGWDLFLINCGLNQKKKKKKNFFPQSVWGRMLAMLCCLFVLRQVVYFYQLDANLAEGTWFACQSVLARYYINSPMWTS